MALLSDALDLDDRERQDLASAATGGGSAEGVRRERPSPDGPPGTGGAAPPAPPSSFLEPIGGWPRRFVGRRAQLEQLVSALDRRRRVVLVVGDAGIGKTRLLDELAKRAAGRRMKVLCGGWTLQGLSPFAGFVGPLRQVATAVDLTRLPAHGALARLLPELVPPALGSPGHADPEMERRLLFGAVADLLRSAGPTLLVLDDAQWADQASLALLFTLATDPTLHELVMAVTARSDDLPPEMAALLVDLERRSDVQRLRLGAFPPAELEELMVEVFAGAGDAVPEVLARVARLSEGNPFFAQELAEQLLGGGADGLTRLEALTALPDRIRAVLDQRMVALAPATRALLGAGAVLGREFDPVLAGRLVDLDTASTIAATEDALFAGLVVEASGARLSFSHALVHTAVDLDLSSLRRVALHRRAASELEARDPAGAVVAADLARHWAAVAAVDPLASSRAAHWAVRAGNEAMAAAATEEAIASYERAARLWSSNTAEHGATLVRLGVALYSCGRISEADEQFRAALQLAEALGDAHLHAHAAIGFGRALVMGEVDPSRVAALERALDILGHDEPVLRPLVIAMLARQLSFERSGDTRRRDELGAELGEIVKRSDLPAELLLSLGSVRDFVASNDPDVLDRLTKRTIAVARESHDLVVQANAWWAQAWSALERGHAEDWRMAVAEHTAAAEALGLHHELGHAARIRGAAAQIEGRFDDADRYGEEAASLGRDAHDPSAPMLDMAREVLLGIERGRADALLPVMEELLGEYQNVSTFRAGLALVAGMAGEHALTRRLLDEQAAEGFAAIHFDVEWLAVVAFYAHATCLVRARDHAREIYPVLASSSSRGVRVGPLLGWWGPVDHHLGVLCQLTGDVARARRHLQRAVELETAFRAAPFLARTRSALADLEEQADP